MIGPLGAMLGPHVQGVPVVIAVVTFSPSSGTFDCTVSGATDGSPGDGELIRRGVDALARTCAEWVESHPPAGAGELADVTPDEPGWGYHEPGEGPLTARVSWPPES